MSRQKIYLVLEIEVQEPNGAAIYPHHAGMSLMYRIMNSTQEGNEWYVKCIASMLEIREPPFDVFCMDPELAKSIIKKLNNINI